MKDSSFSGEYAPVALVDEKPVSSQKRMVAEPVWEKRVNGNDGL